MCDDDDNVIMEKVTMMIMQRYYTLKLQLYVFGKVLFLPLKVSITVFSLSHVKKKVEDFTMKYGLQYFSRWGKMV